MTNETQTENELIQNAINRIRNDNLYFEKKAKTKSDLHLSIKIPGFTFLIFLFFSIWIPGYHLKLFLTSIFFLFIAIMNKMVIDRREE